MFNIFKTVWRNDELSLCKGTKAPTSNLREPYYLCAYLYRGYKMWPVCVTTNTITLARVRSGQRDDFLLPTFSILSFFYLHLDRTTSEPIAKRCMNSTRPAYPSLYSSPISMSRPVSCPMSGGRTWMGTQVSRAVENLSLIHIWRCRRSTLCRSRWSPYH